MNKETIYIEPNDDITTILSKIKSSDKKVVALVPPKKPSALFSSVNMRLIARSARAENKAIVLVTTDDSLIKLAMSAKLPVASSLKSRPVLPSSSQESAQEASKTSSEEQEETSATLESASEESSEENPEENQEEKEEPNPAEKNPDPDSAKEIKEKSEEIHTKELEKDEDKNGDKASSKSPKKRKNSSFPAWFAKHKIIIIGAVIIAAGTAGFLVWALIFAPYVDIFVKVRTESTNFAENVTLTKVPGSEKVNEGILAIREEKIEDEQNIKFTATGQKDVGEPASGSVAVFFQSPKAYAYEIPAGSTFIYNGLEYISSSAVSLNWDGKKINVCENKEDYDADKGCLLSAVTKVTAVAPGEKYNVSGQQSGWSSKEFPSVSVYNTTDISGGTSKVVTIVQQSDVDSALDKLKSDNQENGKSNLMKKLSDSVIPIETSFKVQTVDPSVSPAVGEEVKDGTTPTVTSKTIYTLYTVEKAEVEQFIKDKANVGEGRKLYSYGEPFIEYFTEKDENTFTGKLKTTYKTGPEISEAEVLDKTSGIKIGRVEPDLKNDFSGIASVDTHKSFFWVNRVPKNPNKVSIKIEVEE